MTTLKAGDALVWLQVIAQLIALGKLAYDDVAGELAKARGATDVDTVAADDALLAALRVEIATCKARAQAEVGGE